MNHFDADGRRPLRARLVLLLVSPSMALACGSAGAHMAARPAARDGSATVAEGEPVSRFANERHDTALYAPPSLALHDGRFDLVVHFHGPHEQATRAIHQADLRAAIVNVDLGNGSTVYRAAYAPGDSLERVFTFAEKALDESGRLPGARVGRVALSAWSAGFGAVREILKRGENVERVDAVLLADGFFSDWKDVRLHTVALETLDHAVEFARRAARGEKLFVLTHTAIDRKTYAGAPDCAAALLGVLGLERGPGRTKDPAPGGTPTYATDVAGLHVWGFDGKTWADHVAQHNAMGAQHFAELKGFWEGR